MREMIRPASTSINQSSMIEGAQCQLWMKGLGKSLPHHRKSHSRDLWDEMLKQTLQHEKSVKVIFYLNPWIVDPWRYWWKPMTDTASTPNTAINQNWALLPLYLILHVYWCQTFLFLDNLNFKKIGVGCCYFTSGRIDMFIQSSMWVFIIC